MTPSIPRKRLSPPSSAAQAQPSKKRAALGTISKKPKPTLFDTLDAPKVSTSPAEAKAFLANLGGDDEESSDLSEADSDDFEDVTSTPPSKRRKVAAAEDDHDDDDEMDFEDVDMSHQPHVSATNAIDDDDIGDINISLNDDGTVAADAGTAANRNVKKGPSKRERQIRLRTHMMHVQALVFHNAVRNSWLNDDQVQKALTEGLSEGVKKEVLRWKIDMGYAKPPEEPKKGKKGRRKSGKAEVKEKRDGRDWGMDADRLEKGAVNMSRGDPIMRLLKVLAAYWKKRFTITAPGTRKQGYMPLRRLADEIKHWEKNKDNAEEHGERIESLDHFRKLAKSCEGSRDVGAQLFTALIRGLGIEARMVASLQPVGFGWSKAEDAAFKKPASAKSEQAKPDDKSTITISDDDEDENNKDGIVEQASASEAKTKAKATRSKPLTVQKPVRKSTRGNRPIDQSDSSDLSDAPSSDDASVIDITPSLPSSKKQHARKYDRDLAFPHYWTEVLSPVNQTYIPVDSIVLSTVATTSELLSTFEPRGRASDTAKQVITYVLSYSADATAKDVTVRYLKKHQMPGRTKGFRMMPEKVPIHNKKGKVLRYEEQDWFGTVILPFLRPDEKRTEADEKEDSVDLKPFKPASAGEGKQKVGEESLQWYKQSAEFVLERHLRREEALLPSAAAARNFSSGKGDKAKTEPVYLRSDVVACKTVESWHKEGREIKMGEQPLKMVPVRAVTLIRKREMEETERETGEKLKQGLYSKAQTDWIVPPPIGPDRKIPVNAFGNMDIYVPSMVPAGATHVRLKGCAKICRRLNIEHAEACVGFEFGKQRAVPVIFGVVVAEENEDMVTDAWRAEQEIQKRKEDVKREALMLSLWRKFVMGLRIVERMKNEYKDQGSGAEEVNPFVNRDRQKKKDQSFTETDVDMGGIDDGADPADDTHDDGDAYGGGGGFFLPGEEEALLSGPKPVVHAKTEGDVDMDGDLGGGGFVVDDEESISSDLSKKKTQGAKPMSLQSAHRNLNQSDVRKEDDNEEDDEDDENVKSFTRPPVKKSSQPKTAPLKQNKVKHVPMAVKKGPAKKPAKSTAKKPPGRGAKRTATPSIEDEEPSDLTELSSAPASAAESEDEETQRLSRVMTSPYVVITPKISRLGSIQSRFFKKKQASNTVSEDEPDDMEDDEDFDEDSEEEEVIKPRQTTARTRRSMA